MHRPVCGNRWEDVREDIGGFQRLVIIQMEPLDVLFEVRIVWNVNFPQNDGFDFAITKRYVVLFLDGIFEGGNGLAPFNFD